MVAFWGERYRKFFLEWMLPSMLLQGNIPALANRRESAFLIATTIRDWDAMQKHDSIRLLREYIDVKWFPMEYSGQSNHARTGEAFKLMTDYVFSKKGYGMFCHPDTVLSDNAIMVLQRSAREEGMQAILFPAIRLSEEDFLPRFQLCGYSAPAMAKAAVQSFHYETAAYEWDAPYNVRTAGVFWKKSGKGIILHTINWLPLLLDYSAVAKHDVSAFASNDIDGSYFADNSAGLKIKLIDTFDDIFLASWTPRDGGPRPQKLPLFLRWLGRSCHISALRRTLQMESIAGLNKKFLFRPVKWNAIPGDSLLLSNYSDGQPYLRLDLLTYTTAKQWGLIFRGVWKAIRGDSAYREKIAARLCGTSKKDRLPIPNPPHAPDSLVR